MGALSIFIDILREIEVKTASATGSVKEFSQNGLQALA